MSHLIAKKQADGKLKIFNKKIGKTQGKELPNTAKSKQQIKSIDKQQDLRIKA